MDHILEVRHVYKSFDTPQKARLEILKDIDFKVSTRSSVAIVGPSGSGKTTLLGLCAGLDQPSKGNIVLSGIEIKRLSEDDRAYVRNQYVGFVFQNFQLLPTLTALENVMVPLELRGEKGVERQAASLLERVGLNNRAHHYPAQLSGGEQQRVAIARAFITQPVILFADEPTGNLDEETAGSVTDLLFRINKEEGTTLVLVTHNLKLAEQTNRILRLSNGSLVEDKVLA